MKSRSLAVIAAFLGLALVAGCRPSTSVSTGLDDFIRVRDGRVVLQAGAGPDAEIAASGTLTIGNDPVSVTPEQQALLSQYHADALLLHKAAIATGAAGAKLGGETIRSVVRGLLQGNPDQIGEQIETSAGDVAAKAMQVCRQMGALQQVQDQLAASLPAFQPYATIKDVDARDCEQDVHEDPVESNAEEASQTGTAAQ